MISGDDDVLKVIIFDPDILLNVAFIPLLVGDGNVITYVDDASTV